MTVRAPSDLARWPEGQAGRLGGRLVRVEGASLTVADALGAVEVELEAEAPGLAAGDLVEIDGVRCGAGLASARVAASQRPARFGAAEGDVRRLLLGGVGRRLEARARVLGAVRGYFASEGFLEVETPALVPSPGLDLHLDGCAADGGYLITSPEYQMKRLLTGGLPRIFQLARCFRRGERGQHHNPEFTMLEWYRAFAGYEAVMHDTEQVVRAAARAARGADELLLGERRVDLRRPFARVTVAEAFRRHAGLDEGALLALARDDEDSYFRLMVERVEPALAALDQPVFLLDYPASQASLARRRPDDPRFAERFELYAAGVELCNGFGELTDPAEQRARLEADQAERRRRGLPVYPVDERFVLALEEGMPRAGGNALGLDRLVALAIGAPSLADVQAFPAGVLLRALMFHVATPIGHLITVRWYDMRTTEEAEAFCDAIREATSRVKPGVLCADWRSATILPPNVSDVLVKMFRAVNPHLRRAALLLPPQSATFVMQAERMVREAGNPNRRTFRNPAEHLAWISEVLTPDEQAEVTRFMAER